MGRLPPVLPAGSRPFDFIAVGENSLDLFCVSPSFPEPDEKVRLAQISELPGGQAATAAVACSRLGWRARYVGATGTDRAAAIVRGALEGERVDARLVAKDGVPTRTAVILLDESTGSRTVLEHRDARLDISDEEIPDEVFSVARVMLIDATDPRLSLRAARVARAAHTRIILDADTASDGALELLAHVDVVIVPASFVHTVTGQSQIGDALESLAARSPASVVVATLGPEGAVALCHGVESRVDAVATDVVDTTGAGDGFRAGFAGAWLASAAGTPDLVELLRFAARVAAWNCRTVGAQAGLPTAGELETPTRGRV